MATAGPIAAEPPAGSVSPAKERGRWRSYAVAAVFLLPALVFLGIWVVYPTIYTISRSFYGRSGFDDFVGLDNYQRLFTSDVLVTAIKNNFDLARGRAGARHRDRAHLRRPHRTDPLVGRVQDRRLHADGDLRVRGRDHLADHVRAGSRTAAP